MVSRSCLDDENFQRYGEEVREGNDCGYSGVGCGGLRSKVGVIGGNE